MLLTIQQKFLIEAIKKLGCARKDQLTALLRPVFCAHRPDMAERVTEAALRQLRIGNLPLVQEDNLCRLPKARADPSHLEAIDVMLELSDAVPLEYRAGEKPVLLRFSVGGEKIRRLAVLEDTDLLDESAVFHGERLIRLYDSRASPEPWPVSNRQFIAVRQENGTHRFSAVSEGGNHA